MSRQDIALTCDAAREEAARLVRLVPEGVLVTFTTDDQRSADQNRMLWPLLGAISRQVVWQDLRGCPKKLTSNQWKIFFLDMLNQEAVNVPNVDGTGYVNVGRSSSALGKSLFSDLLELILQFGAERGVQFHDTQGKAA